MKELDKSGLEFVKLDAVKRLSKLDQKVSNPRNGNNSRPPPKGGSKPPSSGGIAHRIQRNQFDDENYDTTAIDDDRYDENINERSGDPSDLQDDEDDQESEEDDAQMDHDMDE